MVYVGFFIVCSDCGYRNRPHKSPREGIRLALTGKLPLCKECSRILHPQLLDRPLVRSVRAELEAAGITPVC